MPIPWLVIGSPDQFRPYPLTTHLVLLLTAGTVLLEISWLAPDPVQQVVGNGPKVRSEYPPDRAVILVPDWLIPYQSWPIPPVSS